MPTTGFLVDENDLVALSAFALAWLSGEGLYMTRKLSRMVDRAKAAATQTMGVKVNIRRTMTPAK